MMIWLLLLCPPGTEGLSEALSSYARKRKLAEVREATDDAVLQGIRHAHTSPKKATPRIAKMLEQKTTCVIAEYNRKCPLDIQAFSGEVRRGNAAALAVPKEFFEAAKAEQDTAADCYPGPVPLVWHDLIVDEAQLAMASAAGAAAVSLRAEVSGKELEDLALDVYGLEVFTLAPEKTETRGILVIENPKERPVSNNPVVARLDSKIEDAWKFRDLGLGGLWVSDLLYPQPFSGRLFSPNPHTISSILRALRAKASAEYATASLFSQKREGSKEYLGDIFI